MSFLRRYLPLITLVFAIAGFYLYLLDGVGMLGPDEPRYAAIGQAMTRSGGLITPHLWGSPWFEKPPLLYWMTALGTFAGLNPELAARLPVALLSLAFLAVSFVLLRREFGTEPAAAATVLLATSAGWMTFSSLSLTDLPMSVFFSLAVFLALPLIRLPAPRREWRIFALVGLCIALAALAKGLVPLALALPGLWFLRRWWRQWWIAAAVFTLVAGPWYAAVYVRNGWPFIEEFFLKHHFARLYSASLQHLQPWYYYLPILLGALFPWTPLLALLAARNYAWDNRRRFLLSTVLFGLLLFTVSRNKLPGYLLPLLPPLLVLIAAYFERQPIMALSRRWLFAPACLIALIPLLAQALPSALSAGRIGALQFHRVSPTQIFYIAAPLATLFLARRSWLALVLVLCVIAGGIYLKATLYPVLDSQVSARGLWRELQQQGGTVCNAGINRDWVYGLSFYRGSLLPPCGAGHFDHRLHALGRSKPAL